MRTGGLRTTCICLTLFVLTLYEVADVYVKAMERKSENMPRVALMRNCSSSRRCADSKAYCVKRGCDGQICLCKLGYLPSTDYTKCEKAAYFGDRCKTRCAGMLICNPVTERCGCISPLLPTKDRKSCIVPGRSYLGQPCSGTCHQHTEQVCDGGICRCKDGLRKARRKELNAYPGIYLQCRAKAYSMADCTKETLKTFPLFNVSLILTTTSTSTTQLPTTMTPKPTTTAEKATTTTAKGTTTTAKGTTTTAKGTTTTAKGTTTTEKGTTTTAKGTTTTAKATTTTAKATTTTPEPTTSGPEHTTSLGASIPIRLMENCSSTSECGANAVCGKQNPGGRICTCNFGFVASADDTSCEPGLGLIVALVCGGVVVISVQLVLICLCIRYRRRKRGTGAPEAKNSNVDGKADISSVDPCPIDTKSEVFAI